MVTITGIAQDRGLICLLLDNGDRLWVRKAWLSEASFSEGSSIEESDLYRFIQLHQYPVALNRAVAMLARRPCSTGEIRQKLRSGRFMADVIELVLYKLEKEQLLNDMEFCEQWIRYRMDCRYGPRRILQELKCKGIPDSMATAAMDLIDSAENDGHAVFLAAKCWKHMKDDENRTRARQKVIASLVRKGYDWQTAKRASDAAENTLNT